MLQISLLGFSLNETMRQTVAFFVGKSTSQSPAGNIVFNAIHIDTEGRWNTDTNEYTVQVAGIYVLNIASGASASMYHTLTLRQSGTSLTQIDFTETSHAAEDTLSKTVLRYANSGDKFAVELTSGSVYSDIRYLTAFSGFLYLPIGSAVAWSVFRTTGLTNGPLNPVSFEEVFININANGGGWNSATNRYTVPLSGVYYVHMTAGFQISTVDTGLFLLLNDSLVMNVMIGTGGRGGYDTRGKSAILRLSQNDDLRFVVPTGFAVFSNANRITSFSGFRLHD